MSAFTKYKAMELPRSVVVGHDALNEVPSVCKQLRTGSPALLIFDGITRRVAGERVRALLSDAGFDTIEVEIADASEQEILRAQEAVREAKAALVLGIGGGRPIDVAKCASFREGVPFISVPTAASHDGIVSFKASITGKDGRKVSLAARTPLAVIADTSVIASAPHRLLAAGCGDIISNSTAVMDWELAARLRNEYYSSYAASLSRMTAQLMIEHARTIKPGLEESAWFVVKALVSSGVAMSIAGSSRPASGSEHKFSHALDMIAKRPGLHGEQCGIGTIMMMYLHGGDWEGIRRALREVGAPITAKEVGVESEEIVEALVRAHEINPERYTILGDKGLTQDAAERVARITKVI
ncbi:MAG: NAD(P)-dependent glycerol-1-phosphate dehydrogenase [Candidatus Thermoplasmatota archaeon]